MLVNPQVKALHSTNSAYSLYAHFVQNAMVYIDDDIMVVNKPSGLLSVPGKGDLTDCMIARLKTVYPETLLIHRLDRDTSGLMVFARHAPAQTHISKQFAARQTQKYYQAIVVGNLQVNAQNAVAVPTNSAHISIGHVNVPVRYDPTRPPMHIADQLHNKQALTYFAALPSLTLAGDDQSKLASDLQAQTTAVELTPVWLKPITGRSHQLRVHMQYIGHAIAGDPLYAAQFNTSLTRLALHAAVLAFAHPVTNQPLVFENITQFGIETAFNTPIKPQSIFENIKDE